ncbi:MAG TPA: rhomboid family intramembrane serine protease [Pirellulales bacterium]|nr:rhomboid family intramembrane serine protease [Pirellulales bacterium]
MTNQLRHSRPAVSTSAVSGNEPAEVRRRTPVTIALLAIPLAVLLTLWTQGFSPFEFRLPVDLELLKSRGANFGPLTANGEGGWRLLAAVFIPANLAQFLFNSWALWGMGRFMERLIGGFALGVLFLLCGFAGNFSALLWDPGAITVGAAPAVLGLVAAGAAFLLRSRGTVSRGAVKRYRLSLFAFLAFNVGGELMQDCLVFAAYLGGAATGFLAGLLLGWRLTDDDGPRRTSRAGFLALAAVGSALFAPLLAPKVDNVDAWYLELVAVDEKAVEIYAKATENLEQGRQGEVKLSNIIEDGILPYWREMSERFAAMKHVPRRDVKRLEAIREYIRRRDEAWQTLADGLRQGDRGLIDGAKRKQVQADEAAKAIASAGGPENET